MKRPGAADVGVDRGARGQRPLRVLLLCGGSSDEHQVSLASARSVLEAVAAAGDSLLVTPIVVTREGDIVSADRSLKLLSGSSAGAERLPVTSSVAAGAESGHSEVPAERGQAPATLPRDVGGSLARLASEVDVVFPLLHGPNGEDGTVQGLLELMGLPYVGSGVLGSAVAMDKLTMKALFAAAGLPQVDHRGVSRHAYRSDPGAVITDLLDLRFPVFVKPANLGSSIGITKVDEPAELATAIENALTFDRRVIVESAAVGARELELAVLGNDAPRVSGVGEIVFGTGTGTGTGFYDYDTKYTDGRAQLVIPAAVPSEVAEAARDLALAAFGALDAAGLARVDLFYLPDGRLLVNELNTMPGFTVHSMYPKLWQAAGLGYAELVAELVRLAMEDR